MTRRTLGAILVAATLVLALPAARAAEPAVPAAKTFSQQDLDQLLAPIALYPDALLAQILMASTYPLEVVQAARWVKENPKITGKDLEAAMQKQPWDPAVKALTAVPSVLGQMNDKLDWTQKLGDAFLAQQVDVMATVQSLRAKAVAAGNLDSSKEQVVKTEQAGSTTIYIIESAAPEVIYVPVYNPTVVYGTWWYAAPPYYVYPPHYAYPPHVAFTSGVVVGAAIWGDCDWHGGGNVTINYNQYNSFNRTNISNGDWRHNVEHRKGVAYRDPKVAQQYDRAARRPASGNGDSYRGRDQRPAATQRDAQPADGRKPAATVPRDNKAATERDAGGFSGVDRGASSRLESQRGSTSRGLGRR